MWKEKIVITISFLYVALMLYVWYKWNKKINK